MISRPRSAGRERLAVAFEFDEAGVTCPTGPGEYLNRPATGVDCPLRVDDRAATGRALVEEPAHPTGKVSTNDVVGLVPRRASREDRVGDQCRPRGPRAHPVATDRRDDAVAVWGGLKRDRPRVDRERVADAVVLRPSDVSNAPELIDRFGVVAVNSVLSVDIYDHVNATHVGGPRTVSGVGGSGDFLRAAHLSVVALQSTAGGGAISRVVPLVRHVDHTEHDVDVVVTEHSLADLRGLASRERADLLVKWCADPAYRPALRAYRERASGGHVPHDFETAFDWRGRD